MSISGDIVQHIEHPGGICVSLELACGVEHLGLFGSHMLSAVPWVLEVSSSHVCFLGGSKHDMAGQWP